MKIKSAREYIRETISVLRAEVPKDIQEEINAQRKVRKDKKNNNKKK